MSVALTGFACGAAEPADTLALPLAEPPHPSAALSPASIDTRIELPALSLPRPMMWSGALQPSPRASVAELPLLRLSDARFTALTGSPRRLVDIALGSYTTDVTSRLAMMQMRADPAFNVSRAAVVGRAAGFGLVAMTSAMAMPGLMGVESGGFGLQRDFGPVAVMASASVARYGSAVGVMQNYGVDISATWTLSADNSVTLFGSHYTTPSMSHLHGPVANYMPAMLPAMGSTAVGGYFSHNFSRRFGVSLGAVSEYNSLRRSWHTRPIVIPYVNVGGHKLGIDVGGIVSGIIESAIENHSRRHSSPPAMSAPPGGMVPRPRLK